MYTMIAQVLEFLVSHAPTMNNKLRDMMSNLC